MEIKFKRQEILSINNSLKTVGTDRNCCLHVPSEESFSYVLNKAMDGNEMAAVQLVEWNSLCKPSNNIEQRVLAQIRKATDEILE